MKRQGLFLAAFGIILIVFGAKMVMSAHYIIGYVSNARDETAANGHSVVLWNPSNGESDNVTDIIGPAGNSGSDNIYMIDCGMLDSPCQVGDTLSIRVYDTGDGYISENASFTVTGAGYDVQNLSLNSPPNISLIFPEKNQNVSLSEINFTCYANDLDGNLKTVSLYGNWTGVWEANETKSVSGNGNVVFSKTLEEGFYKYNCLAKDNLSSETFAETNYSFAVDLYAPQIISVKTNFSSICGVNEYIRINCTTNDSLTGIKEVLIESTNPNNVKTNHSATYLGNDIYYADILLNYVGEWGFKCYSKDFAKHTSEKISENVSVYSQSPELIVIPDYIYLNNTDPIENQEILISAVVFNQGCSDSGNFTIGFYENDPQENHLINTYDRSISARSNISVNTTWNAKIGPTELYVFADIYDNVSEFNENNNKNYTRLDVTAWQTLFGNVSVNKILGSEIFNMSAWLNETNPSGNIFVTDKDIEINWFSLTAFGRKTDNTPANNDFLELDEILNMTNYNDSISRIFLENGHPKNLENFTIYKKNVYNVPIINSSENSSFITGLLWDSSDSSDNEFNKTEKEDIVFVSRVKKQNTGSYGIYDYEIKIPVKLREYNESDTQEVYFYYELN